MGFGDSKKGGWEPLGPSGRKTMLGGLYWRQPRVYSSLPEGQKTNSGLGWHYRTPCLTRALSLPPRLGIIECRRFLNRHGGFLKN